MKNNLLLLEGARQQTNEYLFESSSAFGYTKSLISNLVSDREKDLIVSKFLAKYADWVTNLILNNLKIANILRHELSFEMITLFGIDEITAQENFISYLDRLIGTKIRNAIGLNVSYLTHDIIVFVNYYGLISIKVYPTTKDEQELLTIYLDNIEEEGGFVSDNFRKEVLNERKDDY